MLDTFLKSVPFFLEGAIATPRTLLVAICRDADGLELARLISPVHQLEALQSIDSDGWTVQSVREVRHLASMLDPLGGSTELYQAQGGAWSVGVDVDSDGTFGIGLDWRDDLGALIEAVAECRANSLEASCAVTGRLAAERGVHHE